MNTSRKKNAPDESLLKEIRALKAQVESLERQLESQSTLSVPKKSVEFLISEFNELGQFWRHTDARLESGINLYITASALIVSGAVFFSQQGIDFRTFLFFITLIALVLFMGGVILSERILGVAFVKAEYTSGLNLIRRYFIDADSSIKDYLILPTAKSPKEDKNSALKIPVPPRIPSFLLMVVHIWDSLLLGFIVSSAYWLIIPQSNIKWLIVVGVSITVICFLVFSAAVKLRKKRAS